MVCFAHLKYKPKTILLKYLTWNNIIKQVHIIFINVVKIL